MTTSRPDSRLRPPATARTVDGEYQLLDSGNMRKLERIGEYTIVRPAAQALWTPALPHSEWQRADAVYDRSERSDTAAGAWTWHRRIRREFDILFNKLAFRIKLTDFGHIGLFPEQANNWDWLRDQIRSRMQRTNQRNLHVLNLFAYTGGSTLACSQAGAHVVHVDAAKGVVDWARTNSELSRLNERPIRWLVDDALKFLRREVRRNNRYQGIILDPPSFGRGPKGEVFKIENDLLAIFEECKNLLAKDALFILYSCHTPGFTPLVLHNQLAELTASLKGDIEGQIESGEMVIPDAQGRLLPAGTYARWLAKE